jgi:hypothetical protein
LQNEDYKLLSAPVWMLPSWWSDDLLYGIGELIRKNVDKDKGSDEPHSGYFHSSYHDCK